MRLSLKSFLLLLPLLAVAEGATRDNDDGIERPGSVCPHASCLTNSIHRQNRPCGPLASDTQDGRSLRKRGQSPRSEGSASDANEDSDVQILHGNLGPGQPVPPQRGDPGQAFHPEDSGRGQVVLHQGTDSGQAIIAQGADAGQATLHRGRNSGDDPNNKDWTNLAAQKAARQQAGWTDEQHYRKQWRQSNVAARRDPLSTDPPSQQRLPMLHPSGPGMPRFEPVTQEPSSVNSGGSKDTFKGPHAGVKRPRSPVNVPMSAPKELPESMIEQMPPPHKSARVTQHIQPPGMLQSHSGLGANKDAFTGFGQLLQAPRLPGQNSQMRTVASDNPMGPSPLLRSLDPQRFLQQQRGVGITPGRPSRPVEPSRLQHHTPPLDPEEIWAFNERAHGRDPGPSVPQPSGGGGAGGTKRGPGRPPSGRGKVGRFGRALGRPPTGRGQAGRPEHALEAGAHVGRSGGRALGRAQMTLQEPSQTSLLQSRRPVQMPLQMPSQRPSQIPLRLQSGTPTRWELSPSAILRPVRALHPKGLLKPRPPGLEGLPSSAWEAYQRQRDTAAQHLVSSGNKHLLPQLDMELQRHLGIGTHAPPSPEPQAMDPLTKAKNLGVLTAQAKTLISQGHSKEMPHLDAELRRRYGYSMRDMEYRQRPRGVELPQLPKQESPQSPKQESPPSPPSPRSSGSEDK